MIKITVLGSGASVPSVQRNLPGLAVKFGNVFLFDCGEGSQRQMMKYAVGYGSVKAIFITHMHLDHYLGIFGLLSTLKLMGRKEELYIFGPQGIENLGIDYPFVKVVQVTRQNAGRLYEEKGFSISAFPTLHSAKSFGFAFCLDDKWLFDEKKAKGMGLAGQMFTQIQKQGHVMVGKRKIRLEQVARKVQGRKIVYTGDTQPCKSTISAALGADILFHDSSFSGQQEAEAKATKHSTISQAAAVAKQAGVARLVAIHISPRYGEPALLEKEAQEIFPATTISFDGMEILLKP